jgi:hypothetical protein
MDNTVRTLILIYTSILSADLRAFGCGEKPFQHPHPSWMMLLESHTYSFRNKSLDDLINNYAITTLDS